MDEPTARLYTPEMLALAVRLAEYPLMSDLPLTGSARSITCGSHVEIGLSLTPEGTIEKCGLRAQACAVGQAACAIFADGAGGLALKDLLRVRKELEEWLGSQGPLPGWPGLQVIERAQGFAGRHGAIMLPWRAALAALQ